MKRIIIITSFAGLTTFGIFVFMAFLISSEKVSISTPLVDIPVEVASLPEEKPAVVKPPVIIQPPIVPPAPIPTTPEPSGTNNDPTTLAYNPPEITIEGGGKAFTLHSNNNDEARPIVRVSPKYPLTAIRNGVEGWVRLAFNVNIIGEVVDISIIDSQPKRIFDKAAKQALRKWKYRAKKIDGKAVEQHNFSVQLDFKMAQQS